MLDLFSAVAFRPTGCLVSKEEKLGFDPFEDLIMLTRILILSKMSMMLTRILILSKMSMMTRILIIVMIIGSTCFRRLPFILFHRSSSSSGLKHENYEQTIGL